MEKNTSYYAKTIRHGIHEKDLKLIEYMRELKFGEITIKVQDGLPVMVERAKEKVKL